MLPLFIAISGLEQAIVVWDTLTSPVPWLIYIDCGPKMTDSLHDVSVLPCLAPAEYILDDPSVAHCMQVLNLHMWLVLEQFWPTIQSLEAFHREVGGAFPHISIRFAAFCRCVQRWALQVDVLNFLAKHPVAVGQGRKAIITKQFQRL